MNINTEQVFLVNSEELEQDNLHTVAPLQRNYAMPMATVHPEAPQSSSMCIQPLDTSSPIHTSRIHTCRLCATVTELVVPIFEGEGLQNGLADKIHQHLPIRVCEKDVLPVVLCFQCTSTLLAWHELVLCCVQADAAMRDRLHQPQQQQPTVQTCQTEIKHEKSPHKPSKIIKTSLTEYLRSLNMDDQVTVVCQKCDNNPTFTPHKFTNHLECTHDLAKSDKGGIMSFIKDYVTFEEALVSEMESDADSDRRELVHKTETTRQRAVGATENNTVKDCDESEIYYIEESEMEDGRDAQTPSQVCVPTLLCPFCDSAFSSPTRLTHHLRTHIEISIDDGVQCCNIMYSTKKDYVTHLQENHVNRLLYNMDTMCKSCSYKAGTSKQLKAHIEQWHSEKIPKRQKLKESALNQKFIPAVCPECNKVFSNKYNMMIHLKMHVNQETFKCGRCEKEYSTKGNLAQHVRLAHEGKLPHACGACGEQFPTRGARDIHARIHTGEKPFHCDICDMRFRAKNTLLRHLDIHLGIRKHECPVCNKKFHKWSHLSAHFRVHGKK